MQHTRGTTQIAPASRQIPLIDFQQSLSTDAADAGEVYLPLRAFFSPARELQILRVCYRFTPSTGSLKQDLRGTLSVVAFIVVKNHNEKVCNCQEKFSVVFCCHHPCLPELHIGANQRNPENTY